MYFSDKLLAALDDKVERYWKCSEALNDEVYSSSLQEDEVMDRLHRGYTVCEGNRVQLPCLWKNDTPHVKSNFDYAKKRLTSLLQSKLLQDEGVRAAYDAVFQQWENDSIIQRIVVSNPRDDGYYWAHFPVCRPGRETTKVLSLIHI